MRKGDAVGIGIVALATALGAVREFLFVNLNYQIDSYAQGRTLSYAHSAFQKVVAGSGLDQLILLKWGLAALFVVLMLAAGIALSRVLFGDHRYRKPIVLGTLAIAVIALAFHGLAAWMPALEGVSIALSHALQYPVPLLFIYAASWTSKSAPVREG